MYISRSKNITWESVNCGGNVTKYKCQYCGFICDLWITLYDHICNNHRSFQNDTKTINTRIKSYPCKRCNFASYSLLVRFLHQVRCIHKNLDEIKKNHINLQHAPSKSSLRKHVITSQADPQDMNWFKCEQCVYKTRIKSNLTNHIKTEHARVHKCNQCPFESAFKQNLKKHLIERHTNPKEVKWNQCNLCEYKAKQKSNLDRHMKFKHARENQVQFKCNQCTFTTLYKNSLRNHIATHHTDLGEIKWSQCDHCKYKTKHDGNLEIQMSCCKN